MSSPLSPGLPTLTRQRATGAPTPLHLLVLVVAVAAFGALVGSTQWLAAHFGYDPRLGRPLIMLPSEARLWAGVAAAVVVVVGCRLALRPEGRARSPVLVIAAGVLGLLARGPVYHPARIFEWWPQLAERPEFGALLSQTRLLAGGLVLALGGGTLIAVRPARVREASDSHGSASWGAGDELRASEEQTQELREGGGIGDKLLLGRHDDGSLLVLNDRSGHLLTVATTRSGKGVGTVLTNALGYMGSMFFTDPKAESFFVTAQHRHDRLGHTVYVLDPFEVTLLDGQNSHDMCAFFNPMRLISTIGPDAGLALVRARVLTETLILEGKGDNAFWDRMARQVCTGFILYIAIQFDSSLGQDDAFPVPTPYGRDLITLRFLTSLGAEDFHAVLNHMGTSSDPDVKQVSNILLGADERTRQNIMTSLTAQLAVLDYPQIKSVLGEYVPDRVSRLPVPNPLPHADLARIKSPGVLQTIYLVIPPSFLEACAGWGRLIIVALNDIITRTTAPPKLPIVMMLDEFANMGRIDAVRRGVSLVGGYGVRFWMIVQDLQQVEDVYDKAWGTMFANASVKQLFGTSDLRTAKELSELTGDATVYSDNGSVGKSLDSAGWIGKGKSTSEGMSEKGRKLLLPDEVLGMPPEKQLLLIRGHRPLYVDKLNYLEMPEVRGLYLPNPMY